MDFLAILSSFFLPALIGTLLYRVTAPDEACSMMLTLPIGVALGLGISSCISFLSLITSGGRNLHFLAFECIIALALLAIVLRKVKRIELYGWKPDDPLATLLLIILSVAAITALFSLIRGSAFFSHGGWDAWAFWNLRARFIFRDGAAWARTAFSPQLPNTDYPLLLPALIVRGWNLYGRETPLIPSAIAVAFDVLAAGLVFSSVAHFCSRSKALLATLLLITTPLFIRMATFQYADVPLSCFYLITILLIGLYDTVVPSSPALLALAGLSIGLCSWTKNEGLLFAGAVLFARLIVTGRADPKRYARELFYLAAGFVPVFLFLIYFKFAFAPANAFYKLQTFSGGMQQILDVPRHRILVTAFAKNAIHFGDWTFSPLWLLAAIVVVGGVHIEARRKAFAVTCGILLVTALAGYYFIYLTEVTPTSALQAHLDTSLDRLMLQLWPMFILLFSVITHRPAL